MSLLLDGKPRQRQSSALGGARAVLHFHDGDRLAVDVDGENGDYLHAALARGVARFGGRGRRRFGWFETTDGFLIGADLAAVSAVDWLSAGIAAPPATPLDRDHLVLRFSDRQALQLSQIDADDIDRLRGATLCGRHGDLFRLVEYTGPRALLIPVTALVLATLPAGWMDIE